MFTTKLDLFSIATIVVPTHTKHFPKMVYIPDIIMAKQILKQHVVPIDVLDVKLIYHLILSNNIYLKLSST
jgi:hypothetical protein